MTELLAPGGGLSRAIPHYEDRVEQRTMSSAVARALADDRPLLVEAGTGTGKTLAYLVPALLSGKRVVVSTGTRALQDQIWRHDVPLLRAILGREVSAVVLKGVSNYVCQRRLGELASRDDSDELHALLDWARHTPTGDRAEVDWLGESAPLWTEVTVTPETRIGPRCPHFETCFVTRARRAADDAELILVNHHLYFADLALRAAAPGARILPGHDAVIFDEAHQLEDVATEHFGARISSMRFALLVRDAQGALASAPLFDGLRASGGLITDVERGAVALFAAAREALLRAGAEQADPARAGADGPRVPMPAGVFDSGAAQTAWFRLDTALEDLARAIEAEADPGPDPDADPRTQVLTLLARRARALREDLAAIAEQRLPQLVYWGELRSSGTILTASPIHVGELVRRQVLDAGPTVILTSATLTAADDFGFTRERLGLDTERVDELLVPSPFDYATQALLYLPRDLPEPTDDDFGALAAARIIELIAITHGRAFALFTSHRALRDAARRLAPVIGFPLLVQGDAPRATLVERFRSTPGSVLLGTGSFWEGVDVPGDALSLVVIDKLPFAPHTDPLLAARMRLVAERGGDPFVEVQLPQAAIALKQGFGRLIRRRDDRGIVAVLDPRIVTRRYGRTFVASLPAGLPRTSSIEQVREVVDGGGGPGHSAIVSAVGVVALVWYLLGPALMVSGAFAVGSIPFGVLLAGRRGVDIRREGSGNIGATNVTRVLGLRAGLIVLVLDATKGAIPTWLVPERTGGAWLVAASGLAAILGHCFSPWLGFRGGKGVATALGVFVVIAPYAALAAIGTFAIVFALTRVPALGSLAGATVIAAILVARGPTPYATLAVVTTVLLVFTHRGNLIRLRRR